MRLKLSELSIRALEVTEGQKRYFDTVTPGFGIIVGKRTKTFMVMQGADRRLTTIGKYPEISLADARKAAKRLLSQEPKKNTSTSISETVERYLEAVRSNIRPKTHEEYARYLRNGPKIDLDDLTPTHVSSDPHAVMAWRIFCNWCIRQELLTRNPFQYIKVEYGQRSRILSPAEIKALWQYDHPPYSDIIKLCLLTGQRVGEVTKFNDGWIDEDTITIPASVAKNGREHTLPFNLLTAQYLKQYSGNSFNGFSKAKKRIDEKTGVTDWVVHDLRRTYSTIMASLGVPLHVTEQLLNHRSGTISGVAATYNRYNYLKEMREAVLIYESQIAKLVGV